MHDELRGLLESKGYSLQTHGDEIVLCSAAVSHCAASIAYGFALIFLNRTLETII
jgi:hypothetical protein